MDHADDCPDRIRELAAIFARGLLRRTAPESDDVNVAVVPEKDQKTLELSGEMKLSVT